MKVGLTVIGIMLGVFDGIAWQRGVRPLIREALKMCSSSKEQGTAHFSELP